MTSNGAMIQSAFIRKPAPMGPFLLASIGAHVALVGAVLAFSWFKLTPDINLDQKPIKASLVRLGKKRDEKLLPRKEELPPPPQEVKAPKEVAIDKPPVDNKVAVPVPGVKPEENKAKPQDGRPDDSKKKLFGAFDKLGEAKKPQELEGAEDGDPRGDSATQEGDRYSALIVSQVKRFYDVSQTISEQERMYLKATVAFRVSRTGEVSNVKVVKSSGNDLFDGAVMAAVTRASPLSPPPPEVADEFAKGVSIIFSP